VSAQYAIFPKLKEPSPSYHPFHRFPQWDAVLLRDTDPPPDQRNEVYDIAIDPGERKNLQSRFGKWIHSSHNLFRNIISQAQSNLKDSGRKVVLDTETRDAFKTLGYL